jgi:LemA protein
MGKGSIFLIVIGFLVLFGFLGYYSTYNKAVTLQETVTQKWSDVGVTYQRRADLIPKLVEVVKGAAANEKGILTAVTDARAGIKNATTPDQLDAAGAKINEAIKLTFEAYPQIRSTDNFSDLQAQLEGTENRISVARQNYNEAVKDYNSHIRGFFASMFLNAATFPHKDSFKEAEGSDVAPDIKF